MGACWVLHFLRIPKGLAELVVGARVAAIFVPGGACPCLCVLPSVRNHARIGSAQRTADRHAYSLYPWMVMA
eukprot:jgi/Mesvir1/1768/Mv25144-RA.1